MTESQIKEIMYALTLQRAMAFPKNKTVNGSIFLHRKRSDKIRKMWMKRWRKKGWEESASLICNYWNKQINKSSEVLDFAQKSYNRYIEDTRLAKKYNEFVKNKEPQKLLQNGQTNNICWMLTCYNEFDYVKQCVESIRRNDAGKIVIINDGGREDGLAELAEKYNATYVNSNNYKTPENGNEWWKRFFKLGIESGCDYIIKIDPDAYFCKPIEYSLVGMDFFGNLIKDVYRSPCFVQGGIQGFSKEIVNKILEANIIDLFKYKGRRDDGSFSTDRFLELIIRKLEIFGESWVEVNSVWGLNQKLNIQNNHNYSIIHPVTIMHDSFKFLISEKHANRLGICEQCEFYDIIGKSCLYNNSYIYPLTKLENSTCPLNKW